MKGRYSVNCAAKEILCKAVGLRVLGLLRLHISLLSFVRLSRCPEKRLEGCFDKIFYHVCYDLNQASCIAKAPEAAVKHFRQEDDTQIFATYLQIQYRQRKIAC